MVIVQRQTQLCTLGEHIRSVFRDSICDPVNDAGVLDCVVATQLLVWSECHKHIYFSSVPPCYAPVRLSGCSSFRTSNNPNNDSLTSKLFVEAAIPLVLIDCKESDFRGLAMSDGSSNGPRLRLHPSMRPEAIVQRWSNRQVHNNRTVGQLLHLAQKLAPSRRLTIQRAFTVIRREDCLRKIGSESALVRLVSRLWEVMLESGGVGGSTNDRRDAMGVQLMGGVVAKTEQPMGSVLTKTADQEPTGKNSSRRKNVEIEGSDGCSKAHRAARGILESNGRIRGSSSSCGVATQGTKARDSGSSMPQVIDEGGSDGSADGDARRRGKFGASNTGLRTRSSGDKKEQREATETCLKEEEGQQGLKLTMVTPEQKPQQQIGVSETFGGRVKNGSVIWEVTGATMSRQKTEYKTRAELRPEPAKKNRSTAAAGKQPAAKQHLLDGEISLSGISGLAENRVTRDKPDLPSLGEKVGNTSNLYEDEENCSDTALPEQATANRATLTEGAGEDLHSVEETGGLHSRTEGGGADERGELAALRRQVMALQATALEETTKRLEAEETAQGLRDLLRTTVESYEAQLAHVRCIVERKYYSCA